MGGTRLMAAIITTTELALLPSNAVASQYNWVRNSQQRRVCISQKNDQNHTILVLYKVERCRGADSTGPDDPFI